MTLSGLIHKVSWFSEPETKNEASWLCATGRVGHYLWPEVGPTTVTLAQFGRVYSNPRLMVPAGG